MNATEAEHELVLDILDDEGTIDIDERAEFMARRAGRDPRPRRRCPAVTDESHLIILRTRPESGGRGSRRSRRSGHSGGRGASQRRQARRQPRARARPLVCGRDPVNEQVNFEEQVEVERRPADRGLHSVEDAFQERTIEMEEHREEPVVSKEARVKELLVVKDVEQRTETVSGTVRSTEVEVEDERGNTVSKTGTKDRT